MMNIYPNLAACPQCGSIYRRRSYAVTRTAVCKRCQAVLWRSSDTRTSRLLPLSLAAGIAFCIACLCPVMTVSFHGIQSEITLWQVAWFLPAGKSLVALTLVTVFLLIFAPVLQITLTIWLLVFAGFHRRAPGFSVAMKILLWLHPWCMPEVVGLGFLVAAIKLSSLLEVVPGPGGWALAATLLLLVIINNHDLRSLWRISVPNSHDVHIPGRSGAPPLHNIRGCDVCGLVTKSCSSVTGKHQRCPCCLMAVRGFKADSIMQSWALLSAAIILYIPANFLPVMYTSLFDRASESTIMEGVTEFWRSGSYGIAIIIFVASVVIPCMKFLALGLLLVTTRRKSAWARRERTQLYRITEWIGCWSMLDVIVVAVVCSLVQFNTLSEAEPRSGILFFALVVILTMLSALRFDPRLIWENNE